VCTKSPKAVERLFALAVNPRLLFLPLSHGQLGGAATPTVKWRFHPCASVCFTFWNGASVIADGHEEVFNTFN
jgi:hypothetical protein